MKRPTERATPRSPWIWRTWPGCCRRWAGRPKRAVFSNARKPSRPRNRTQRLTRGVHSDPVIGKSQVRLGLDSRHVARHAGARGHRRAVLWRRMARGAGAIVPSHNPAHRGVGRVAGETGERALALQKTDAFG